MQIILAGGGHAHIGVMRAWAKRKLADSAATLITPDTHAYYSGMLPGWMAGIYRLEQCMIDVRPLSKRAGVELRIGQIVGLDAEGRSAMLADGDTPHFDILSLAIGSETDTSHLAVLGDRLLPIRPIPQFVARWPIVLAAARQQSSYRLVIVGGGAAGVEIACAAADAIRACGSCAQIVLIASADGLLQGFPSGVARLARRALERWRVDVFEADAVGTPDGVILSDGQILGADCVIAATGGRPPTWLLESGLALDQGYVLVDAAHRSVSHADIFAAGDIAARRDTKLAKSGVNAVYAGPILAVNLRAQTAHIPLRFYHPRRRTLYLIATGSRRAIFSWGRWTISGPWVWRLKDWIDRRFVNADTLPSAGTGAVPGDDGRN